MRRGLPRRCPPWITCGLWLWPWLWLVAVAVAQVGDPAFTTLWEALAVLVSVKLWLRPCHTRAAVELRSDSLADPAGMNLDDLDERLNRVVIRVTQDRVAPLRGIEPQLCGVRHPDCMRLPDA